MPEITPELVRRTLTNTTRYEKILEIRKASKISLVSVATNASTIRLATKELSADEAREYFPLEVADAVTWEATRGGEELSWTLWALAETSGDVLVIAIWR